MACNEQPIRIHKGATRTFRLTVRDEDGELVNLDELGVDDDIIMTVATEEGAETATFQKSIGDGITALTQEGDDIGKADIVIAGDDTSDIESDAYFQRYDVILLLSGEQYQLVEPSDFEILPVVTLPLPEPP